MNIMIKTNNILGNPNIYNVLSAFPKKFNITLSLCLYIFVFFINNNLKTFF